MTVVTRGFGRGGFAGPVVTLGLGILTPIPINYIQLFALHHPTTKVGMWYQRASRRGTNYPYDEE